MRHEPSGSCLPVQPAGGQRCSSCRVVKPSEDFPDRAGTPTGCCATCRRRRATVARRHRQRTLQQLARRAEAGYRAPLAHYAQRGGKDAA